MVQYTFQLKLPDTNDDYIYSLDLTLAQENDPDRLFDTEIRERMRQHLQDKSGCAINDANLERMIQAWKEDIREGYRSTAIALSLPPIGVEKLDRLNEQGNQALPDPVPIDFNAIDPQIGALPSLQFF